MLPIADFVTLWNESESANVVARVIERPVETVRRRASNLRCNGYRLKSMRNDIDVNLLSKLAQEPRSMDHSYFVIIWQNARSWEEVIRFTGINSNGVCQKAKQFRQAGVPLKRFNRRSAKPARTPVSRLTSVSLCPKDYLGDR